MAVDITGFQRMRREQEARQQEAAPAWESMAYNELKAAAKEVGIEGYHKMKKGELIEALKSR